MMCIRADWGQNWDVPRYQKQPGELYFLSRQKVGSFGVTDEGSDLQTFYCVPEGELTKYSEGPNPNAIPSCLCHYLQKPSYKPKKLIIYPDNCGAQNKNNYLLWFFSWLSYHCSIFEEVEISFLITGHTKFSPDRHFGYAKSNLNKSDNIKAFLGTIDVIKSSATNQLVIPVGELSTNNSNALVYDWKKFLISIYRKALSGMKLFSALF